MKLNHQLLLILFLTFACNEKTEKEREAKLEKMKPPIQKNEIKIEEGFTKISNNDYLSDKLLIAKKGKLKGYKSLHIKGHQFYDLSEIGNITATYDISNNYGAYTYDKKNRLIRSANKIHSPAEVYYDEVYNYSKSDSVIQITKIFYKNNKPREREIVTKDINLDSKDVLKIYFEDDKKNDLYLNSKKGEIITYDEELLFCCGVIMKGKNKLIYYLNENELFDSLVIEGIQSKKRINFIYKYNTDKDE